MDENLGGRLELTHLRARTLLGAGARAGDRGRGEGEGGDVPLPGEDDVRRLATQLVRVASLQPAAAEALARSIVERARTALEKTFEPGGGRLTDEDALALESVIHVRGRPAVRVLGARLESLDKHPGAEFWEIFVSDFEGKMVEAAGLTGALLVSSFSSGQPRWVQGSAWLLTPNRVVTNRHVLLPGEAPALVGPAADGRTFQSLEDYQITISFAQDDRGTAVKTERAVKSVLYVAPKGDPVDIAVLEIEPYEERPPLRLEPAASAPLKHLFVVGHPGPVANAPADVQAVFGRLDGKKRVSFGKVLTASLSSGSFVHDASTVGGFSGAPVIRIDTGRVSGLHYYGDPTFGNLAVSTAALRAHAAFQFFPPPNS